MMFSFKKKQNFKMSTNKIEEIIRGHVEDLPEEKSRIVSIFLSSTFTGKICFQAFNFALLIIIYEFQIFMKKETA